MGEWHGEREWYNDRIFEAIISTEDIDRQHELVRMSGLEKVMDWFVKYGVIHYKHSFINFAEPLGWKREGDVIKIKAGAHTNYEGLFPHYDWIWKQIKDYYLAGVPGYMSIGGSKVEAQLKCDDFTGSCFNDISKLGIFEASWVGASPANTGAAVTHVNVMAKSEPELPELIQKPFGPWKDWDACMAEMRQQYDEETAKKVCGKLKSEFCGKLESELEAKQEVLKPQSDKMTEEGKVETEVAKQEEPVTSEAPPAEENPMAMIMRALEELKAMLAQMLKSKEAPITETKTEAPAESVGGKPGEVRVSFKSDEEFAAAVQKIIDANKIVTKTSDKPSQVPGQDRGSFVAKAIEEAMSARSAKEFFNR